MGAQHLRVPYGLIRQLCYSGGVRLEPRVNKKNRPAEPELHLNAETVWQGSFTPAAVTRTAVTKLIQPGQRPTNVIHLTAEELELALDKVNERAVGNLANESYRFFRGSRVISDPYFQCRGCLAEEYSQLKKVWHLRNCRPLMQGIEERVRRDRVCMMCNQGTKKDKWTIPLCSDSCIARWRFQMPEPWLVARRFVLAADPKLLIVRPLNHA